MRVCVCVAVSAELSGGVADRVATAILYLNPAHRPAHGGQLRLHPSPAGQRQGQPAGQPASQQTVEPVGGRLVVFGAGLEHQVPLPRCPGTLRCGG